jgi:hypothetical protein
VVVELMVVVLVVDKLMVNVLVVNASVDPPVTEALVVDALVVDEIATIASIEILLVVAIEISACADVDASVAAIALLTEDVTDVGDASSSDAFSVTTST